VTDQISKDLNEAYKATIIEVLLNEKTVNEFELLRLWNSAFFIITAANPYSKQLNEKENCERDSRLEMMLKEANYEYLRAVGRNLENTWREPGWAVNTSDETAMIGVAKVFEQNAIFRVSAIGREIVNCLK
jgi:Protein of unknown function (DUF3293)